MSTQSGGLAQGDDWGCYVREKSVCFVQQGDEAIVRVMQGIYDSEPTLTTTGDRYTDIILHRNQFIVNGQLVGVIRRKEADWVQEISGEDFWGC